MTLAMTADRRRSHRSQSGVFAGAPVAGPGMFGSVCIFVYVGADDPLEVVGNSALRLTKLKSREHKQLLRGR